MHQAGPVLRMNGFGAVFRNSGFGNRLHEKGSLADKTTQLTRRVLALRRLTPGDLGLSLSRVDTTVVVKGMIVDD